MKKDNEVYLLHILDAIHDIENHIKSSDERDFKEKKLISDAVSYKLQIIGEAAGHLPESLKLKITAPWKEIIGMRHVLVHGYDDVDLSKLWFTAKNDLSSLKKEIKKYLKSK